MTDAGFFFCVGDALGFVFQQFFNHYQTHLVEFIGQYSDRAQGSSRVCRVETPAIRRRVECVSKC